MSVQITITDVPEEVRDKLAKRAALRSLTLEEFLRRELARMVAPSKNAEVVRETQKRLEASKTHVPASEIVRVIRASRQ